MTRRPPPLRPAISLVAAALLLAACNRPAGDTASPTATPSAGPPTAAGHAFSPAINATDFAERVKVLASDEFEGRAPGSPGEQKTVAWLEAQFKQIGLKPGNGNSYFQTVPMTETTADPATVLRLDVKGQPRELQFGPDMVVGTRTGQAEVKLDASELVFVGYGVNAPEQGWNDYAGVDVKGKTVVILINDPGFHQQNPKLFEGKRMTYYGRWVYKFEEAARQGAAAALIIHDTEGAAYGWHVVENGWKGPQFDLPAKDDPAPRLPAQGWLTADAARSLFGALGHDLDGLYKAAGKRGFKAIPLQAKLSLDLKSSVAEKASQNVLALLPGSKRPDETIAYVAHWDHLGHHAASHDDGHAAPAGEDTIYNGAIDNATGVAGILEIAEAFAKQGPAPERSVLFAAVTLEESGLLGSKYYVANPTVALGKTVAVINLDAMPVNGRSRDITVIGHGSSELEDLLTPIAEAQGRVLTPEATPEDGFYFRSDHFNFAKAGVPALYVKGGDDLVEGGTAAGHQAQADYRDQRYHKPSDEFDPGWKLDGAVQDLEAVYAVGRQLAASEQWPRWYPGNAFRAAQDKLRPVTGGAAPGK